MRGFMGSFEHLPDVVSSSGAGMLQCDTTDPDQDVGRIPSHDVRDGKTKLCLQEIQGAPPASRSTPLNSFPEKSRTSPSTTPNALFH
jgi:hypothetical protein